MNKLIYPVLLCLLLNLGCKENRSSRKLEIEADISLAKKDDVKQFSNIVDTCFFVNLETNKDNLIGKVDKIVLQNDKIYLLDKEQSSSIFIFDIKGNFISKIQKIGKGPGEYSELSDFNVNNAGNIIVNDGFQKKLIYYSSTGEYIKENHLRFPTAQFALIDDGYVFIGSGYAHNLIFTDTNGRALRKYFPYNRTYAIELINHFPKSDKDLLYQQTGNDTIFIIKDKKPIPSYLFEIEDKEKVVKMFDMDFPKQISRYNETTSFIYFSYTYEDEPRYVLYSKKSGKYLAYSNKIEDDLIKYPYAPQIVTTYNNYFVAALQPYLLKKNNSKYLINNKLTASSNPVIGFYKFKAF